MTSSMPDRIGVCSWSLEPASPRELVKRVLACGLQAVQLALDPLRLGLWDAAETKEVLEEAQVTVVSGMLAMAREDYTTLKSIQRSGGLWPDATFEENLRAARQNAALARSLDLPLVTLHAGFLPAGREDPKRRVMCERLDRVAQIFLEQGVRLGLETGQEQAQTLKEFLEEAPDSRLAVNFDPANMLLYGSGDPLEALRLLSPWIAQIHVKDAFPTRKPGRFGKEMPLGEGRVGWESLLGAARESGLACDLLIERESGQQRVRDVRSAHALLRRWLGDLA